MNQEEWKYYNYDLSGGTVTITHVPCLLKGVVIGESMSAHACEINDGGNEVFKIPASSLAGDQFDWGNTRTNSNAIIAPNVSATGELTVIYRILRNV